MKIDKAPEEETPLAVLPVSARKNASHNWLKPSSSINRRQTILTCSLIFLIALGCRLLSWQDNRFEARKVQTQVTAGYKHTGRLLRQGGVSSFFSANSPLADPNHIGHPPGYSILMAAVFSIFGESDAALQIIQILADAAAAVVVFLIALTLLSRRIATIAGLLVALAPQFTYNSVLLLPDSLAVLPLLLAVYFLIQASKRPRLIRLIVAGALIGLSCWLRANALLLVPLMALIIPILFERGQRVRYTLALVGGAVLVIAPLTIRNFIVYDHFVPVSLGAGQTLLEGLADYDTTGSLDIPDTDMGLMKWEAEFYRRPDYYGTLFNPDGVWRDRERMARGFAVIRSHPFWFFGVMLRRGAGMLRLERVRLISADPPVTHALDVTNETPPIWSSSPSALLAAGKLASRQAEISLSPDDQALNITGDASKYDNQFISAPMTIEKNTDYILRLPVRIEQGRMIVSLVSANGQTQYASTIIEPQDWRTPDEQMWNTIEIPFVSASADQAQIVFANGGSKDARPIAQIGETQLYALGPSSFTWTRIPRALIRLIQKLFVTAVMLPLAIIGLLRLILTRRRRAIALLLIVPAYFLCIQSALHTEYRYVLAIHYFLFVLVAVSLSWAGNQLWSISLKIPFLQKLIRSPQAHNSTV